MRLRTTAAAVLVGAAALVLPTAAPSLADDHGGRGLGTLHYRFVEEDGDEHRAQIRPADNDTCYLLTHTSRDEPAVEVVNETRSLAVLFDNRGCSGRAERVLRPGERARNVEVVAVYFKPVDGRGDGNGRGDGEGRGDEGRGDGNGRDDEGRGDQGRGDGEGRGEQGRGDDEGRGENGARDDEARGDEGRGDEAREENGREDAARDEVEADAEDLFARVLRSMG